MLNLTPPRHLCELFFRYLYLLIMPKAILTRTCFIFARLMTAHRLIYFCLILKSNFFLFAFLGSVSVHFKASAGVSKQVI